MAATTISFRAEFNELKYEKTETIDNEMSALMFLLKTTKELKELCWTKIQYNINGKGWVAAA